MIGHQKRQAPAPTAVDLRGNADGKQKPVYGPTGNKYECLLEGIYYTPVGRQPQKLCGPLEVVALTRDKMSDGWGIWVRFKDPDGKQHDLILPRKLFTQGKKVEEVLASAGLILTSLSGNSGKCPLAEYFNAIDPDDLPRGLSVEQGGYPTDSFDRFVFSNAILPESEGLVMLTDADKATRLNLKGTLEQWHESVSDLALHSKRMMFALSAALAAPLLQPLGLPSICLHFYGRSGGGKTTLLNAAASVYGGQERLTSWDKTSNNVEAVATKHNNQPLIIDEIGQGDIKTLDDVAYKIGNGIGRGRANRSGGAQNTARWSLVALSAGESSLEEIKRLKSRDGRTTTQTGQRVRFVGVPCDAGAGVGICESVPGGLTDSKKENDERRVALLASVSGYSATGVAGKLFLERLIQDIREKGLPALKAQYKATEEYLQERVSKRGLAPTERRVLRHFAAVAFAGELGIAYGVFGAAWETGAATEAARVCFEAWRDSEESPERHLDRVVESMLAAPSTFGSEYLQWVKETHGIIRATGFQPNRAVLGRLILETAGNTASWLVAVYQRGELEELIRRVGEGESKDDILQRLIVRGNLLERGTPQKSRKGQIQPSTNNAFGLPRSGRVFVLIQSGIEEARRVAEEAV